MQFCFTILNDFFYETSPNKPLPLFHKYVLLIQIAKEDGLLNILGNLPGYISNNVTQIGTKTVYD